MTAEFETLKKYVEDGLASAKKYNHSRSEMLNSCSYYFGAVMYAERIGLVTYEEVNDWWENTIRPAFWFGEFAGENDGN